MSSTDVNESVEKQLATLAQSFQAAAQRAVEFLTLANGGGVISCLTVIASQSSQATSVFPVVLLAIFLVGLLLVGAVVLHDYYFGMRHIFGFIALAKRFFQTTDIDPIQKYLNSGEGEMRARWDRALIVCSFVAFWIGAITASVWLLAERFH